MKKVAIVMGSASDAPVAQKAQQTLREFGVPSSVRVLSAHRTAEAARAFALEARAAGYGVLICMAGMAAHLAGAMAAGTTLPVIGVPIASGALNGVDALYSTVMMPPGIPVATVAVGGGRNAALLAVQMLAIEDEALQKKLDLDRQTQALNAQKADADMQKQFEEA